MKIINVIVLEERILKLMSECGIKVGDYKYIPVCNDFNAMRYEKGLKYEYVIKKLSKKYDISESTVKRLIRKMNKDINEKSLSDH